MSDTSDRWGLRRIDTGEGSNSGKPAWRFPETRGVESKRGYWARTVVHLLESEYKGYGMEIATQRPINTSDAKLTRTGAEIEEYATGKTTAPMEVATSCVRLCPAGKRLSRCEAAKARFHSPQGANGGSIWWGFNSHDGFYRGVTCANSHVGMNPGPPRWRFQAELIRRGGSRRFGKSIPPRDIGGMIRQLREQNRKEEEDNRVSGEGNPRSGESVVESTRSRNGNAVSKGNPVTLMRREVSVASTSLKRRPGRAHCIMHPTNGQTRKTPIDLKPSLATSIPMQRKVRKHGTARRIDRYRQT